MSASAENTLKIETTPVKEQPTAIEPSAAATAAAADANASAAATPARLNANAKSFVPVKLDEAAVGTAASAATAATSAASGTAAPPTPATTSGNAEGSQPKSTKKSDRSPKAPSANQGGNGKKAPPYAGNGTAKGPALPPPNFGLAPGLIQQPFMPPHPGMPFMPSPMMMGNPMLINPMALQGGLPMGGMPGHPHPHAAAMTPHAHGQHPLQMQMQMQMAGHPHLALHPPMGPPPPMPMNVSVGSLPPNPMLMNPMAINTPMHGMPHQQQGGHAMTPHGHAPGHHPLIMAPHHPMAAMHHHQMGGMHHPQQQQQQPPMMPPMPGQQHQIQIGLPPHTQQHSQPPQQQQHHQPAAGQQPAQAGSSVAGAKPTLSVASPTLLRDGPATGGLVTLIPSSPLGHGGAPTTGLHASMNVSVGNASLAALRSTAPAKFACVILIGLPSSGKTTLGRQLVSELSEDKMGWSFFSGSDYLKESATKKAPWETTRDVFDGLGAYIDTVLGNQATNPTRGLVIDKNVKGIEDIYYLSALLKSKGLLLNGIVSFESTNDEALLERLGGEDGKERLKFYRVILNRIQEGTKGTNLYHAIDTSKPLADSLKSLRTQVLGCSAVQNVRSLNTTGYGDTNCQLVEDYLEYFRVITAVTSYAKTPKANQFPGLVNYTPLSTRTLDDRKFRAALTDGNSYYARRKVDGSKFVLYHENGQLYLVPRHQRAVLRVPTEAWIGFSLASCGPFILDGELVRMSKEAAREKFLVYDVVFWAEKGSTQNTCRGPWKERQDRLKSYLVNETNAFFQVKTNIVIVHQRIVPTKEIGEMFDGIDYPVEGIAFHPTARREDPVILWRPPRQITADFRLGTTNLVAPTTPASPKENQATYTCDLEVFDSKSYPARYVVYGRYGSVEVVVGSRQTAPTPGAIVTCGLQFEGEGFAGKRSWRYLVARPDLTIPIFKIAADELLDECIVPKERLLKTLVDEKLMVDPAAKAAAEAAAAQLAVVGRTGFGTHLPPNPEVAASNAAAAAAAMATVKLAVPVPTTMVSSPPSMRDILIGLHKKTPTTVTVGAVASPTVVVGVPPPNGANKPGTPPTGTIPTFTAALERKESEKKEADKSEKGAADKRRGEGRANKREGESEGRKGRGNKDSEKEATNKDGAEVAKDDEKEVDSKRRCADCKREKNEADGRVDKSSRNRPFYCFGCWAKVGHEFCNQCSAFAKGHRESRARNKNAFYCENCWTKYDERKKREKEEAAKKEGETTTDKDEKTERTEDGEEKKKERNSRRQKGDKKEEGGSDVSPKDGEKKSERRGGRGEKKEKTDDEDKEKKEPTRRGGRGEKKSETSTDAKTEDQKDGDATKKERKPRGEGRTKKEDSPKADGEEKKEEAKEKKERKPREKKSEGVAKDGEQKKDASPDDGSESGDEKRNSRRGRRGGRGRKVRDSEGDNSASASASVNASVPLAVSAAPAKVVAATA